MFSWPDLWLPPINLWSLPYNEEKYRMIEPVKGELWETRGGELMEIVKVSEDHRVAIMAVDSRKVLTPYRRGGYFISEKYEHMLDLIRRHG